jgi:hypothetical protein
MATIIDQDKYSINGFDLKIIIFSPRLFIQQEENEWMEM